MKFVELIGKDRVMNSSWKSWRLARNWWGVSAPQANEMRCPEILCWKLGFNFLSSGPHIWSWLFLCKLYSSLAKVMYGSPVWPCLLAAVGQCLTIAFFLHKSLIFAAIPVNMASTWWKLWSAFFRRNTVFTEFYLGTSGILRNLSAMPRNFSVNSRQWHVRWYSPDLW